MNMKDALSSKNKNPINPPARDDCFLATHPSDHNSIYVTGQSHNLRQKREQKTQKRRERDLKRVKDGKMDEAAYKRGSTHDTAFLVPVPLYYYPVGFGYAGGCASGVGGCASGGAGGAGCGGSGGGCGGILVISLGYRTF